MTHVRFQGTTPTSRGTFPGVFALVNGLSARLTPAQETFRRTTNAWYHAHLADPSAADPTVYDRTLHPTAAAWFRASAHECLDRVPGYLAILTAHHVPYETVWSDSPGRVIYADVHQIVVT
ncbi:MAG: hypothetical protein ABIQ18_29040 [Umezawaea sp.]